MLETLIEKMKSARNANEDLIPGLLFGDTGIAIVHYLLEKYTGNAAFGEDGRQLLDNIFEEVETFDDVSWDAGLPGIGWGVEWLVQQGLLPDADTDLILAELDSLMALQKPDISLSGPSIRDLFYFPARMKAQYAHEEKYVAPATFYNRIAAVETWLEEPAQADRASVLSTANVLIHVVLLLLQFPDNNMVLINRAVRLLDRLLPDQRICALHKTYLAIIYHFVGKRLQQQQWQEKATYYIKRHSLPASAHYKTMDDAQLFMLLKIALLVNLTFPDIRLKVQIEKMITVLSNRELTADIYSGYGALILVYMGMNKPSLTNDWHQLLFTDISTAAIPKVIHLIVGPTSNSVTDRCVQSWDLLKHNGYKIRIWNDDLITLFLQEQYPFAVEAFTKARNHGEAADIARYLIIHAFGGYYMDWDIELLQPDKFLQLVSRCPYGYLVVDPTNGSLASEAFAARKHEPYLLSLTQDIIDIYNGGLRETLRTPEYSGPYRMRDSLQKHANSSQQLIPVKEIFLYDYSEIRRMPKRDITSPLIHYWLHSWMKPAPVK